MENGKRLQKDRSSIGGKWLFDLLQPIAAAVIIAVLLMSFVIPTIGVVGPSMRETLQNGDRLIAVKGWLCGEYRRGDIVVARKDSFDEDPIIKRVIAVGGETVMIDFESGTVSVDGTALKEDYIREITHLDEGMTFPLTVPEGCVFLMGDNRNNSDDSRDPLLGTVDERELIGRAVFLLYPGRDAVSGERDFHRIGMIH